MREDAGGATANAAEGLQASLKFSFAVIPKMSSALKNTNVGRSKQDAAKQEVEGRTASDGWVGVKNLDDEIKAFLLYLWCTFQKSGL